MIKPLKPILWSPFEAAAACGGALVRPDGGDAAGWVSTGLSIDTRTLALGDIFVALTGTRDGHDFLRAAATGGAAAAIVSEVPADAPRDLPLIKVNDTLGAMEALGRAARDRCFGRLIGVTGSAGKTTTKEMLRAALSGVGATHAASASYNNHLGVPLTLAALPARSAYGVFEIGMNHAGEITPLVGMVRPHVAIITNIGEAHLENFESRDGIAEAKAEILSGVRAGGTAVLPIDSPYYPRLLEHCSEQGIARVFPFGQSNGAADGVRLMKFRAHAEGQLTATYAVFGEMRDVTLHARGEHMAMNAAAVIAACVAAGAPLDAMLEGLGRFAPGGGRGAVKDVEIEGKRVTVLDESYNANPSSMAASLSVLGSMAPRETGRRIAILGGMKELGPTSPQLHASLAKPIAAAGVELVLTAGEEMLALRDVLPTDVQGPHAPAAVDLFPALTNVLKEGDVLLFKGSNASGLGALVNAFLSKSNGAG